MGSPFTTDMPRFRAARVQIVPQSAHALCKQLAQVALTFDVCAPVCYTRASRLVISIFGWQPSFIYSLFGAIIFRYAGEPPPPLPLPPPQLEPTARRQLSCAATLKALLHAVKPAAQSLTAAAPAHGVLCAALCLPLPSLPPPPLLHAPACTSCTTRA
jgi:hypothetical protein